MNPRLALLLSVVGAGGLAGVLFGRQILQVNDGVTMAELRDAGIAQGQAIDVACPVRLSDARLDALEGAGRQPLRYRLLAMQGRLFDAGVVLPDDRAGVELVRPELCHQVDAGGLAPNEYRVVPLDMCACARPIVGNCLRRQSDGGFVSAAGWNNTMGPGEFQGSACRRKACSEYAGESSWPPDCVPQ
jgi:hypothetical protein